MSTGKLIILSGPSGVGKDTIIDEWKRHDPRVVRVIAYTTRNPREGEVDGVDYHFVSRERFLELAHSGAFLEYKEVHGNFYATPLSDMEALLIKGYIAILKIDVQGAIDVMPLRPDAVSVFLLPPDVNELRRRIEDRGRDNPADITRRMQNSEWEMSQASGYQYQIVNDEVATVVERLKQL